MFLLRIIIGIVFVTWCACWIARTLFGKQIAFWTVLMWAVGIATTAGILLYGLSVLVHAL